MTLLNTIIATSVVALGFVAQNAAPVNALAAGNPHAARHAGLTPNHNGMLKRKRASHKNRKRCVAQQQVNNVSSSVSTPAPTDTSSSNNNSSGDNSSSNNNNNNTPAPYVPPVTHGSPCSSGKVILAWGPDMSMTFMPNAITSRTCYYYNWSPWAGDSSLTGGLRFLPMFWSDKQATDYSNNVLNSGSVPYAVLAMNEVNQDGQAKMDIWKAKGLWEQYIMPMRQKGSLLGSPSVTSAPDGITWLRDFTNILGGDQRPDFYCVHWYGTDFGAFKDYLNSIHDAFGADVWVTEFACTDFSGQGLYCDPSAFADQAKPWLDSQPWIGGYAPFAWVNDMSGVAENNRLMDGWGNVVDLGRKWIN